jgi:hypothetical protein
MGRLFRLRKWYFDFLTPGFDYCFIYFADVSILGATFRSLTLHLARRDKEPPVTKSIALGHCEERVVGETDRAFRFHAGSITISQDNCTLDVSDSSCSLHLKYARSHRADGNPVIIGTGGKRRILWQPLQMRCRVSGTVVIDGETLKVSSTS